MPPEKVEDIEMNLLLEGVMRRYGHDFRDYAPASLKRRLRQWLAESRFENFSDAQAHVLRDDEAFDGFLRGITVNVSEMFRDPQLFRALRKHAVPFLRTFPYPKLWVAGCATGEEVYSLAILLHEEGLGQRCRIYATDINEKVLQQAREGIFSLDQLRRYTQNYQKSGGTRDFSDYYTARYGNAILAPHLKQSVVFAAHNLVTDSAFGEMNLILCRNVLIYFTRPLIDRVLLLFDGCLHGGGYLALGQRESLDRRAIAEHYSETEAGLPLYRNNYG